MLLRAQLATTEFLILEKRNNQMKKIEHFSSIIIYFFEELIYFVLFINYFSKYLHQLLGQIIL